MWSFYGLSSTDSLTVRKAECGGIEPPRPYSRPQTGFEDRPGHQAHAFRSLQTRILVHRLPVSAGQDPHVASAAGHPGGIGVLEPGLGVLAAGPQAVAQAGERDLTLLPTSGLYLFHNILGGLAGTEKVPAESHHLPAF